MRGLYRTLETPGANRLRDAHAALDAAVRAAYGMNTSEDTLAFLLRLNLEMARTEASGKAITPPRRAVSAAAPGDFLSENCLHAPSQAR